METQCHPSKHASGKPMLNSTDPLRDKVAAIVRGKESIGTAPLLDLLDMPKTTGNARRIGGTMRSLGFVPLKSRRFLPGGYRDTTTRGWARPVRASSEQGDKVRGGDVTALPLGRTS
jgi:hypothetical protein